MAEDFYVVRVIYKNERIEIHEYKNKHKALHARDKFRAMETVQSAKIITGDDSDDEL